MSDNFIIEASEGLLPTKGDAPAASEKKEVNSSESLDSNESVTADENEQKASDLAGQSETESTEEAESNDEAESNEEESEETEDQELEKKAAKKKKGGFARKIERLQREIEQLRSQGSAKPQEVDRTKESSRADDSEPNPNDFDTNAEYIKAMVAHAKKQALTEIRNEFKQEDEKKNFKTSLDSYNSKVSDFKKEAKDFDSVVKNFTEEFEGDISPTIHGLILKHEQGPKLFYELAKDPEEFERINSLDPYYQAYEIGKLEAKISSQSKPKQTETKKLTTAPPPAKPVQSKSAVIKKDIYSPDLTQAEYEKLMNERMKNYRRY